MDFSVPILQSDVLWKHVKVESGNTNLSANDFRQMSFKQLSKVLKDLSIAKPCVCGNKKETSRYSRSLRSEFDGLKSAYPLVKKSVQNSILLEGELEHSDELMVVQNLHKETIVLQEAVAKKQALIGNMRDMVTQRRQALDRDNIQLEKFGEHVQSLRRSMPERSKYIEDLRNEINGIMLNVELEKRNCKAVLNDVEKLDPQKESIERRKRVQSEHAEENMLILKPLIEAIQTSSAKTAEYTSSSSAMATNSSLRLTKLRNEHLRMDNEQKDLKKRTKGLYKSELNLRGQRKQLQDREDVLESRRPWLYDDDLDDQIEMHRAAITAHEHAWKEKSSFLEREVERMESYVKAKDDTNVN